MPQLLQVAELGIHSQARQLGAASVHVPCDLIFFHCLLQTVLVLMIADRSSSCASSVALVKSQKPCAVRVLLNGAWMSSS